MNIKKIIDPSHPRSTFKPTYHVQPLDPDLRKTEHRSAQAAPRPGPIRQRTARTVSGEALARHLRMKGIRIAVERTLIPAGWRMAPEVQAAVMPGSGPCAMRWQHGLMTWKKELNVGKRCQSPRLTNPF